MRDFIKEIKDYIFPIHCLNCDKEGEWLCPECLSTVDTRGIFRCPLCNCFTFQGESCGRCAGKTKLLSIAAIAEYGEEKIVGKLIKAIKYAYAEEAISVIEKMIDSFLINNADFFATVQTIVPVPLHPRRFAERGFNQALLIAKILAQKIQRPVVEVLQRQRYTPCQVGLSREKRQQNLHGAFALSGMLSPSILLVDDVYTTGSTMQECAKVLRKAGVKEVRGLVVARGF